MKKGTQTFITKQFIEYLEVMNVMEFSGFNEFDFDYFTDKDPKYQPFLKDKFRKFMECPCQKKYLKKYPSTKFNSHVGYQTGDYIWGSLVEGKYPPEKMVNITHFTLHINLEGLNLCLNMEGKRLSKLIVKKVQENKKKFLDMLLELGGIYPKCCLRLMLQSTAKRQSEAIDVLEFTIQQLTREDIDYLVGKMTSINEEKDRNARLMVNFRFPRGDPSLKSDEIVKQKAKRIDALKEIYDFMKMD